MTDLEMFNAALERTGGNKAELARRVKVSNQTIHSWKTGSLTELGRLKLEKFLADGRVEK